MSRTTIRAMLRNSFVRNVGVLAGGTALAQAIMVLILPVLTRLYTPEEFSLFAVFASLLGIISTIACLRLEIAIAIPESDETAANLLALALLSATGVALVTGCVVWTLGDEIVKWLDQPGLRNYLWLLSLGVWLSGTYTALQYWATRRKQFALIARTRFGQAIGGAAVQSFSGWLGAGSVGLILGHLVYRGAGIVGLAAAALRGPQRVPTLVQPFDLLRTLRDHARFPRYSTSEALANIVAIELPVLIIAATTIGPEVGYLMLATRVMGAPMALVGTAVAQVYLSRAPDEMRRQALGPFTMEVVQGLCRTGIGPIVFVGIVAPYLFPFLFGEEWERAGEFVSWMTPWFVMQFLATPVSMALHVTQNQRIALILQLAGVVLRVGVVLLAANSGIDHTVEIYAMTGLVFYTVYLFVISYAVGTNSLGVIRSLQAGLYPAALWAIAGLIMSVGFQAVSRSLAM